MRLIIIFCTALFIGMPGYAQDSLHNNAGSKAQSVALKFERELQLTTGQQEEVNTVLKTYFEDIERAKTSQDKETAHNQIMQALREIFTEEQYHIFIALREKNRVQKEQFKREHPDYQFSEEDEELDI